MTSERATPAGAPNGQEHPMGAPLFLLALYFSSALIEDPKPRPLNSFNTHSKLGPTRHPHALPTELSQHKLRGRGGALLVRSSGSPPPESTRITGVDGKRQIRQRYDVRKKIRLHLTARPSKSTLTRGGRPASHRSDAVREIRRRGLDYWNRCKEGDPPPLVRDAARREILSPSSPWKA